MPSNTPIHVLVLSSERYRDDHFLVSGVLLMALCWLEVGLRWSAPFIVFCRGTGFCMIHKRYGHECIVTNKIQGYYYNLYTRFTN